MTLMDRLFPCAAWLLVCGCGASNGASATGPAKVDPTEANATGESDSEGTEPVCDGPEGWCIEELDGMMRVPQGSFWMGCRGGVYTQEKVPAGTPACGNLRSALPYKEVTLDEFWIDKLEVTKGAYRECFEAGACALPNLWDLEDNLGMVDGVPTSVPGPDNFPVASANWTNATNYCAWVGKRLPTEAEWEKAARGIDGRRYPWGQEHPYCDHANHIPTDPQMGTGLPKCSWEEEWSGLMPVGMFPLGASPYGVLDMAGNVAEWTQDGFQNWVGYESLPSENPTGVESDKYRVYRGGSYQAPTLGAGGYTLNTFSRAVGGIGGGPTLAFGFRCARDSG